ncbi:hypothetical protein EJ05DRAFT_436001 [Pseudovirgaria hyperparasitica]|uniref:Uncharacterized protein n=1 Tax=Pseudovirgaria hyperparasitica TaxID=470096 RepID=A0A6A6WH04_9PEZI|nr:uncharacterized protein EJ05DRAFT_436001 [Pseudovirgaria hyperparasitica]KAF2760431.1 hypothetical protein EJ05DRAFT_436001 [Pseudovirgaria hyperparasitica]
MGILKRAATLASLSIPTSYAAWTLYTRNTSFVPFTSYPESTSLKRLNPRSNPPACIDHAVRRVPLSKLKTQNQEELTKRFCQGIWGGLGFAYQRRFLEKKYRALEGREGHLWEKSELKASAYDEGTAIADHFEVVERAFDKVVVRCGDSPLKRDPRPSDGIFEMQVTIEDHDAVFHLKSVFFNSTPDGTVKAQLPWWFDWGHKQYTKLWMETSVRKLLK